MPVRKLILLAIVSGIAGIGLAGCDRDEGPAEESAEAIDNAADDAADKMGEAADDTADAAKKACEEAKERAGAEDTDC